MPDQPIVEYRPIKDFPGYRVGSDGSVWSSRSRTGKGNKVWPWRQLKPGTNGRYLTVTLCNRISMRRVYVHRLVLEVFIGPCPENMEACHFPDNNTTNNRLENLRWDTPKSNGQDQIKHGVTNHGRKHHLSLFTDDAVKQIRIDYANGKTQNELAKQHGTCRANISCIVLRKTWKHV